MYSPEYGVDITKENRLLAEKEFASEVRLLSKAKRVEEFPTFDDQRAEVAFAGRSNVGKSSLLNALVNRKSFVKVSKTPGCTQELGFFQIGQGLVIVDMPGYGYAEAPRKLVTGWNQLVGSYLTARRDSLARTLVLVDSRRGILPIDNDFMDMLDDYGRAYQIVLTKIDCIPIEEQQEQAQRAYEAAFKRKACLPIVMSVSAREGWGVADLRALIVEVTALPNRLESIRVQHVRRSRAPPKTTTDQKTLAKEEFEALGKRTARLAEKNMQKKQLQEDEVRPKKPIPSPFDKTADI